MAKKKASKRDTSDAEKALEARVDAMMDPKADLDVSVHDIKQQFEANMKLKPTNEDDAPETINVKVVSQKTAPELPPELLKKVKDAEKVAPIAATKAIEKPETTQQEPVNEGAELEPAVDIGAEATEEAVDDIVAHEGDTVLAVDDARVARKKKIAETDTGWKDKLKAILKSKWTWLSVAAIVVLLLAVPYTRYTVLGVFIKRPVSLVVTDSKSGQPISDAQITFDGVSAQTDGEGKATVHASLGSQTLTVAKQQYKTLHTSQFVGFSNKPSSIRLTATGRLVPVTVLNKVTGKPVVGAVITSGTNTGKTNTKGMAIVALPVGQATRKAIISHAAYNRADVTIQVTDAKVKANTIELTPSGKLYFLSNQSGKLDVVKADLDGSQRKVVLEGTGKEQAATTSLLASRDWRYLVLKARRDGAQPALYLIDTHNDKVTQFESGDGDIQLIGWYNNAFVYSKLRNTPGWQTGRQQLKSYDAKNAQLNLLDQSLAEGDASSYIYQDFSNFYLVKNALVYTTIWQTYSLTDSATTKDKQNTIRAVEPSGQNKKDYQTFGAADIYSIFAKLYAPQEVYFAAYSKASDTPTFYEFENLKVTNASIDQSAFDQDYPTYLISPNGTSTFWAEVRDGKNTLFAGDANAGSRKQIVAKSEYSPYGWFGEEYVLVSKDSSELYITATASLKSNKKPPLKITDYYKPPQSYQGYGYGYGGL